MDLLHINYILLCLKLIKMELEKIKNLIISCWHSKKKKIIILKIIDYWYDVYRQLDLVVKTKKKSHNILKNDQVQLQK